MDLASLFAVNVSPWELIFRGSVMYWFLFLVFRFLLRRDVGSIGVADVLLVVLIADASQNAMTADYTTLSEGLILVSTLIVWNYLLDWLVFNVQGARTHHRTATAAAGAARPHRAQAPARGAGDRGRAVEPSARGRHRIAGRREVGLPRERRQAERDPLRPEEGRPPARAGSKTGPLNRSASSALNAVRFALRLPDSPSAHGARNESGFRQAAGSARRAGPAPDRAQCRLRRPTRQSALRRSPRHAPSPRAAGCRRCREVIDDVQQVGLAALVGAAVALDQPAAERDLVAERPSLVRAAHDRIEPAFDQRLLGREANAAPAQPAQSGQHAQRGKAGDAVGADLERQCERRLAARLPAPVPAGQRLRECSTAAARRLRGHPA